MKSPLKMLRYIIFFCVTLITCSCTTLSCSTGSGDLTYCFETGKIQCLSEINPSNEVTILLKSLKNNTTFSFDDVLISEGNNIVVKFVMVVKDENPICASWTDVQSVHIGIDPKYVQEFTLTGKEVYNHKGIRVLIQ